MKLIVEKPFKSIGVFYNIGDIIDDPLKIRFLRTKLGERKVRIIEGSLNEAVSSFNSPVEEPLKDPQLDPPNNDLLKDPIDDSSVVKLTLKVGTLKVDNEEG